jgi:hypothetical protein
MSGLTGVIPSAGSVAGGTPSSGFPGFGPLPFGGFPKFPDGILFYTIL